jgi:hypothetical protein
MWNANEIFRTTKCFGSWSHNSDGTRCNGAFPNGFLKWVKENGFWGDRRVYLCSGIVEDLFPGNITRVDIRPECRPDLIEDARHTSLPAGVADWIMIDPPYSRELAAQLYGTEKYYSTINEFTKEANRIVRPGGLICTLTYEIPKRIHGCNFIAVCGVYTVPMTGHMRCFTVSQKVSDGLSNIPAPKN